MLPEQDGLMCFKSSPSVNVWAGIAKSVKRLATRWTVGGSNLGGGQIFRTPPNRPWGPPSFLYNGYRVSFPGGGRGVKWPWRGANDPLTSSAEVKERVELYIFSPSGRSWPLLGRNLPFKST
jgi:hypothetical protein